jgi:hypothetical protein
VPHVRTSVRGSRKLEGRPIKGLSFRLSPASTESAQLNDSDNLAKPNCSPSYFIEPLAADIFSQGR